ncbi:MAG: hypothetical protein ACFFA3_07655 [Promethearchaeota archaeon]
MNYNNLLPEYTKMKKISYNLRIGIVANKEYYEVIFLDNLRDYATNSKSLDDHSEYFIVFNRIPIKILTFSAESLEDIIFKANKIEKLDVIILTLDLADKNSINQYDKNIIDDFFEMFYFQGISILVGIDRAQIFKKDVTKGIRISRYSLKDLAKYLNLIYCFEICNKESDVKEIYRRILNDFVFRFRYTNSELFKQARIYGNALIEKGMKNIH